MSLPDGAAAPAVETENVFGVLAVGGVPIALPLMALREVVPCPARLSPAPVDCEGVVGFTGLRGLVLPVVDLRPRLGLPGDDRRHIVVVADGDRVAGLLCDEVRGIERVPTDRLTRVGSEGDGLLLSHTFPHGEAVVSVLDARAVLDLPGLPHVRERTATGGATEGRGAGGDRRTLTVFEVGGHAVALDVDDVHVTLPGGPPRASVLTGPLCRGTVPYGAVDVPVVDPLSLLGLQPRGGGPAAAGAHTVLGVGAGYVALAVTRVVGIADVHAGDVVPLAGMAVARPDLVSAAVEVEGHVGFVLDAAALRADPELAALGALNTSSDEPTPAAAVPGGTETGGSPDSPDPVDRGRPYLAYQAGVDVATPLEQINEIIPYPGDLTPTDVGDAVLGIFLHRRAAVVLLCLRTVLGMAPGPVTPRSCVLLVRAGDGVFGFAVDGMHAVETLTWRDAATRDDLVPPGRSLVDRPLIRLSERPDMWPDLDLGGLARQLAEYGVAGHLPR